MDVTTKEGISPEVLDQLLAGYERPEDLTCGDGLFPLFEQGADRACARRGADGASGL